MTRSTLAQTPLGASASPTPPPQNIYVANSGANSILEFPITANGNVAPSRVLTGTLTELASPTSVGVDQSEIIYAPLVPANGYPARVGAFTPNQSGNVAPVRIIIDAETNHMPLFMAVDPPGNVYIFYHDFSQHFGIDEFPPGANGILTPIREIHGKNTLLLQAQTISAFTVDDNGGVYWACNGVTGTARVVGYAPGASGDVKPVVVLDKGPTTLIKSPSAISVDQDGYLYVQTPFGLSKQGVLVFAPGATGPVAPVRKTRFNGMYHLGTVSAGTLLAIGTVGTADALGTFDAHHSGIQSPKHVITGSMTQLATPAAVQIR